MQINITKKKLEQPVVSVSIAPKISFDKKSVGLDKRNTKFGIQITRGF